MSASTPSMRSGCVHVLVFVCVSRRVCARRSSFRASQASTPSMRSAHELARPCHHDFTFVCSVPHSSTRMPDLVLRYRIIMPDLVLRYRIIMPDLVQRYLILACILNLASPLPHIARARPLNQDLVMHVRVHMHTTQNTVLRKRDKKVLVASDWSTPTLTSRSHLVSRLTSPFEA